MARQKVIFINGFPDVGKTTLSKQITSVPNERVNTDHVAIITALKYPQILPLDMDVDDLSEIEITLSILRKQIHKFLRHLKSIDAQNYIISEYVSFITDRDWGAVKVIEGYALEKPWFKSTVNLIHKNHNHRIIEVDLIKNSDDSRFMIIDDVKYTWDDGTEHLQNVTNY
jgi:hypothetical protein